MVIKIMKGGRKIFNNPHYLTRGIEAEIPPELQLFLWECIERLPEPRDYFQVFKLHPIGEMQGITHSSEQPEYKMEYLIPSNNPITAKIYIIDSDDYSTMLLAEEY